MANYLVKFGDYDLSELIEEASFNYDSTLNPQIVPNRHGVVVTSLATIAIRFIRLKGKIYGTTVADLRDQSRAIEAALGTDLQELFVGFDDRFYYAWKTKYALTPVIAAGRCCGIIEIDFVCDNPFVQAAEIDENTDYLRNVYLNWAAEGTGITNALLFDSRPVVPAGTVTRVWDSDGSWLKCECPGTASGAGGLNINNPNNDGVQTQELPIFYADFKTASISTPSYWRIGLAESQLDNSSTLDHEACIIYDSAVHTDGFWHTQSNDQTPGIQTDITGIPFLAETHYQMKVDLSGSDVKFYINGQLVSTHSKRPGATTIISHFVTVNSYLNDGINRYIYFGNSHIETAT